MLKFCLLISIFICLSCESTGVVAEKQPDQSVERVYEKHDEQGRDVAEVVQLFMRSISERDEARARILLAKPTPLDPAPVGSPTDDVLNGEEALMAPDWVPIFIERRLSLRKVVAADIEGNKAGVMVELGSKQSERFRQVATFRLRKEGDAWRISDIELRAD
jgi:hypothetical protein